MGRINKNQINTCMIADLSIGWFSTPKGKILLTVGGVRNNKYMEKDANFISKTWIELEENIKGYYEDINVEINHIIYRNKKASVIENKLTEYEQVVKKKSIER